MTYTKTTWKDRVVEKPRNYTMANNADGSVTLTPSPGVVTEAGTPIIAANLNNIEEGIANAHTQLQVINANYPLQSIYRQAIINGNFDIWQRYPNGATSPVNGAFVADRWKHASQLSGTGYPTSIFHGPRYLNDTEVPGSYIAYKFHPTGAGSAFGADSFYGIVQLIENGPKYFGNGKTLTLSFWARSDTSGKRLATNCIFNYPDGSTDLIMGSKKIVTLTPTWQKFSITFTTPSITGKITSNTDSMSVGFFIQWGSKVGAASFGTGGEIPETFGGSNPIEIAQVQLSVSDTALPYSPKTFAQELHDCMRYFEKSYDYNIPQGTANAWSGYTVFNTKSTVSNGNILAQAVFKVKKRCQPTCFVFDCVNGYIKRIGNVSPYVDSTFECTAGQGELKVINNSGGAATASDTMIYFHWIADAEI